MFSGLMRSRRTLAKNSSSSGYLDVGGLHFFSFGTRGKWLGVTRSSSGLSDGHLYLPPSSCHPKHVFKAIPFGVATRLKRNCSGEIFLAKRTAEYRGYLVNQGYPSKLVNDQFSKASTISRNDLLRTRGKEANKLFPFVLTFSPNLPNVGNIIRKHLLILQSNPK